MWQYSIFGSGYLGFAKFLWRIVCPFHVKNVLFGGRCCKITTTKHGTMAFLSSRWLTWGHPLPLANLLKLIMVHQPPIAMKDAPMSMMLKLGALLGPWCWNWEHFWWVPPSRCAAVMALKMPMLATGKMLFYISVNFCQRQKIKGRLMQSP